MHIPAHATPLTSSKLSSTLPISNIGSALAIKLGASVSSYWPSTTSITLNGKSAASRLNRFAFDGDLLLLLFVAATGVKSAVRITDIRRDHRISMALNTRDVAMICWFWRRICTQISCQSTYDLDTPFGIMFSSSVRRSQRAGRM